MSSELQKIVVLCVVGVIIIGGGWYLLSSSGSAPEEAARSASDEEAKGSIFNSDVKEPTSGFGTFAELMGLGQNVTCTISYTDPESKAVSEGTVFVAGERMRGDFTMTENGEQFESHMIQNMNRIHTWAETPDGSFAMVMDAEEGDDDTGMATVDTAEDRSFRMDQDVEYHCSSWGVDESKFIPPSNIEFQDMNQMMEGMMPEMMNGSNGVDTDTSSICAMCDQAPDAASKAECRVSLGCE